MPITAPCAKLCREFARSQKRPADPSEFCSIRRAPPFAQEPYSVSVNYDGLVDDVSVGDNILVDNGMIRLTVLEKRGGRVRTRVITPGRLGSRRHINLPGVHVNLPPLTEKDLADISLGAELGADFVALSFVRQKSDLDELRGVLVATRS